MSKSIRFVFYFASLLLPLATNSVSADSPHSCTQTDQCTNSVDSVFANNTPALDLNSVVSDPGSPGPLMIGDRFGGSALTFDGIYILSGAGGATAVTGRIKLAELFSPIPRTRVYLNHSYFKNTILGNDELGGQGVHRYMPGVEIATSDGQASIEFRLPFANTIDKDDADDNHTDTFLGNFQIIPKVLLWEGDTTLVSVGMGIELPTADDLRTDSEIAENKAYHLMPFIGSLHTFDRLVIQSLLQFDFFAGKNKFEGVPVAEEDWLYLSLALSYYLVEPQESGFLRGVIPTIEAHYSQSISRFSSVGIDLFAEQNQISDVNLVIGTHFLVGESGVLTAGYTVPLTRNDGQFDGETRLAYNLYFDGASLFQY